jgi:hypothetical protein
MEEAYLGAIVPWYTPVDGTGSILTASIPNRSAIDTASGAGFQLLHQGMAIGFDRSLRWTPGFEELRTGAGRTRVDAAQMTPKRSSSMSRRTSLPWGCRSGRTGMLNGLAHR